jgi:hypothetical protein
MTGSIFTTLYEFGNLVHLIFWSIWSILYMVPGFIMVPEYNVVFNTMTLSYHATDWLSQACSFSWLPSLDRLKQY